MGVIVDEQVLTCSIPPARFFKAFIVDSHNLIPKILPTVFKSIEYTGGNGGPGSIKVLHFYDGDEVKSMKHKVEELDEANLVYKFSIIEGENMGTDFEAVSIVSKVEAGPDGGCTFRSINTYTTKGDNENVIQASIKKAKDGLAGFFQAVVGHLHANPDAYN
ncbi:major strawberry allergen Fra a 1.08-like [Salvia miltiorrhiza]|uniref:Allergen n=1 Tax=Salvia miltiorrhiza TaxID=226208 RepID=F6K7I3_SALMI|nr:major strawberry allergen Fra a 1.08-like [Salvia miltiorrhiza]ADM22286.1 allergen [Salvia miltiorrhiza]